MASLYRPKKPQEVKPGQLWRIWHRKSFYVVRILQCVGTIKHKVSEIKTEATFWVWHRQLKNLVRNTGDEAPAAQQVPLPEPKHANHCCADMQEDLSPGPYTGGPGIHPIPVESEEIVIDDPYRAIDEAEQKAANEWITKKLPPKESKEQKEARDKRFLDDLQRKYQGD